MNFQEILTYSKIYIDSRFRSNPTASSHTDFTIQLPVELSLPDNTICYIDDVVIPNTFYTVEESVNNKLYYTFILSGSKLDYVLVLREGNYTGASLATHLQNEFDAQLGSSNITVTYNTSKGNITIRPSGIHIFRLYTDAELKTDAITWTGLPLNKNDLQSANNIFRHDGTSVETFYSTPYISNFLDLMNHHTLFIHMPNLTNFKKLSMTGADSIVKKVPVNATFGFVIFDNILNEHDYIDVSKMKISQLRVIIKDALNRVVNTHGSPISLSLKFVHKGDI